MSNFDLVQRQHVQNAFLSLNQFGKRYQYVSAIEGTKPVTAVKLEHGGGPDSQQHIKLAVRRATFHIAESLTDGVRMPSEGDTIVDDTGSERVVWGVADSKTMKLRAGMWSIEFTTAVATKQGFRQAAGL